MAEAKDYTVVTYNNTQYEFQLVLVNEYFNIFIPHNIVESIIIVDDLYNVFTSATIVLNNSRNNIDIFSNYKREPYIVVFFSSIFAKTFENCLSFSIK